MDQEEYNRKRINLKVLKSIQEYMKTEDAASSALYPIKVPEDLLYQVLRIQGPDSADKLIHHIFRMGLDLWSDEFFNEAFGSQRNLEQFIKMMKKRNRGEED
ncbi:MAG: hypothetical protein KJ573_13825 [Proteobacteria bacterium]|jgi:hypothetical protein|nr:hypothetical protein [Desulfobacterales bacterium]MBL7101885.1 hypothetical protein [Desulfobacteraceae bacterium]MBU0732691.1 hypothetical protein [Pseudomonadota bacterium]MBL7172238.1 hypothetical protein [Desulfobacteraceae bacterium]MBU0990368.1 hypothetical protein [Pseudomonadota bacterium]